MKRILTFEPNKPDPTDVAHIIKDAAEYANKECYRTDLLSVNHINVLLHVIELLQEEKQEQIQSTQENLREWSVRWEQGDVHFVPELMNMVNSMVQNPSPLLKQVGTIASNEN
ncbi:hypothetical protein SAMN05428981_10315 [Bacillus sp. OV194]|nr:hypothetical protein SAMN05428981_10315 [Bacillus sp. OV194]